MTTQLDTCKTRTQYICDGCPLNTKWSVPEGVVDVEVVAGRSVIVVVVVDAVFVVVAAAATVAVEAVDVLLCVEAT